MPWTFWALMAVVILGCCTVVCVGLGLAVTMRLGLHLPLGAATPDVAATAVDTSPTAGVVMQTHTSTPTTRATSVRVHTATPSLTATGAPTHTPLPRPTRTPLSTPGPTPSPTLTRRPLPSPTPTAIVCDDLGQIGQLTLLPGQRFSCTIGEEALSEQLRQQPDMPCEEVAIDLSDGEVLLTCQMGVKLRATGVVDVQACRMSIRIVRGTIGFTRVVQNLLDANLVLVPDAICVEEATVREGEISISGRGR